VSTTSLEVSPWCTHAPAGRPTDSWTTSTNAATSWSVTRSRSSTAAGVTEARRRIASASAGGITPSFAPASPARSSTSSHVASRASSVNSSAISGRAYRGITRAPFPLILRPPPRCPAGTASPAPRGGRGRARRLLPPSLPARPPDAPPVLHPRPRDAGGGLVGALPRLGEGRRDRGHVEHAPTCGHDPALGLLGTGVKHRHSGHLLGGVDTLDDVAPPRARLGALRA